MPIKKTAAALTLEERQLITDKIQQAVTLLAQAESMLDDVDFSNSIDRAVDLVEEAWYEIHPEAYEQ